MKTFHVGGLKPIRRYKTIDEVLSFAKDDDTIELHKDCTIHHTIDKNIIINGNGNTLRVESGNVGFTCNVPVVLRNLTCEVCNRANAFIFNDGGHLEQVAIKIIGPIRALFPALILRGGKLKVEDSSLCQVSTHPNTRFAIRNSTLDDYYGNCMYLLDNSNMSIFNGRAIFTDCKINHCSFQYKTHISSCELGVYNNNTRDLIMENCTVRPQQNNAKVVLNKEPKDGPLNTQQPDEYFALRNSGNISMTNCKSDIKEPFLGLFSTSGTIEIHNMSNDDAQGYHILNNTNLACVDVNDTAYYDMRNTTVSLVRSHMNLSANYQTAMEKLESLVGLQEVKHTIKSIMNTITVNQTSKNRDFGFSYHMVFAGDPGTGKTTVAKIVAQALFEIGAIPENKCTEVSVDKLVKGFVGQTAENVRKILDDAVGGVLFIDEAYELTVKQNINSFNSEVLSVLIRYMEEHREDLVVIAAGYTKEMKEFLASNVGLQRRFQWIDFKDYTSKELVAIFEMIRTSYEDTYLDEVAIKPLLEPLFAQLTKIYLQYPDANYRTTNGGNGGLVRNVYQRVLQNRNNRLAETTDFDTYGITQEDILLSFKQEMKKAVGILR